MTNNTTDSVQSLRAVQNRLQQLNTVDNLSFRKIAATGEFMGIPAGTLAHIAKGREPKDPHTRDLLHLPVLIPAPACSKCGQVHVTKRCQRKTSEPRAKPIPYEHYDQVAVIEFCRLMEGANPELKLLYAVPNGGKRNVIVARKLKAEGVRSGVPDLCLPVPRGTFHGLYIELKHGDNKPTPEQYAWMKALTDQGYCAEWRTGAQEAIDLIFSYLKMEERK